MFSYVSYYDLYVGKIIGKFKVPKISLVPKEENYAAKLLHPYLSTCQ